MTDMASTVAAVLPGKHTARLGVLPVVCSK
jgi:hypothetical protein